MIIPYENPLNLFDSTLNYQEWCGQEDSNFHGIAPTATSTLRVYHSAMAAKGEACFTYPWHSLQDDYDGKMVEFIHTAGLVNYEAALAEMEARVAEIRAGTKPEAVWLLEHPSLYTGGTSAKPADLLAAPFPVHQTGRGGQYTYHGPGQRIAYVMLDLQRRGGDVRKFVWQLEEWIIRTLAEFGITGERREGRIGIWVSPVCHSERSEESLSSAKDSSSLALARNDREAKIAAIGVRVRHGVTYHGMSINVDPDLSHYAGIVPCGIDEFGVTSMAALGKKTSLAELDQALKNTWTGIFEENIS